MTKFSRMIICLVVILAIFSCGGSGNGESESTESIPQPRHATSEDDPMANKGIGPIKSVVLNETVDHEMAEEGQEVYNQYCTACHKPTEKFIGPAPKDILKRRSPEWIMNMILNPEVMVKEDPIAKKLLVEFNMAPMAKQPLTEDQARQILEYFRTL